MYIAETSNVSLYIAQQIASRTTRSPAKSHPPVSETLGILAIFYPPLK